ncbi:hypothetical protein BKA82DRAFT_2171905 [Pisolithus tinctorius]|nr:hypothetical protein BKA82DRAFT_2171905 [Pisolithus tinctorius]
MTGIACGDQVGVLEREAKCPAINFAWLALQRLYCSMHVPSPSLSMWSSCSPDHQILFLSLLAFLLAFCSQHAAVSIIRDRHSVLLVCSSGFKGSGGTQLTPIREVRPTTAPAIPFPRGARFVPCTPCSGITSTIKQWLTGIVPDESVDAILGTRSSRHSAACVLVYY